MTPIIHITNLSKSYSISHEGRERYTSLRDVIAKNTRKIFSFPKSLAPTTATKEEFWALKDVSFDIEQGERVGIIGRNGAGKSTLLKILSRITEPTTGAIKIKGRVASLLEVGTGFHPELTGRENIYLNGAILGMSRAEIKKHFDAIVDFAETEKFLDTPVKRYSSGMYVRLAFAVAAHLEPEILVVDEVLAVGDAQFQKKCLGKMEDVSRNDGRTVLFVSHNMSAIINLCNRGILLSSGKVEIEGKISEVVSKYNTRLLNTSGDIIAENKGNSKWWINSIRILQKGQNTNCIDVSENICLKIEFEADEERKISFEIVIKNSNNDPILFIPLGLAQNINFDCVAGKYMVTLEILFPQLALGEYHIDLFIVESFVKRIAVFKNIISFEVISSYIKDTGWVFQPIVEVGNIICKVEGYAISKLAK